MNDQQLIDYYKNLLIMLFRDIPEVDKHLVVFLKQVVMSDLIEQVKQSFNIETATGDQLTKLGTFIGVDRRVSSVINQRFFGTRPYAVHIDDIELQEGLSGSRSYSIPSQPGLMWRYSSTFNYVRNLLTDSEFRKFIQMKIAINKGNCSLKALDDFFRTFFGGLVSVNQKERLTLEYGVEPLGESRPELQYDDTAVQEQQTELDQKREFVGRFFSYMLEKKIYPKPAGINIGSGFVVIRPQVFATPVWGTALEDIPTNITGTPVYGIPLTGVTALYGDEEGEDYAKV